MNHSTLHVSFEIKCHGYNRNFLSVDKREAGVEKKITSSQKCTAYSCTCLISGSEDGLQFFSIFLVMHIHTRSTQCSTCAEKKRKKKKRVLGLFVARPLCTCKSPPYILKMIFPFDDLFLLLICALQYFFFFLLYNKKPQT